MKIKIKETYICRGCKQLKKKEVEIGFGLWSHKCLLFDVGRELDSENCDNYG